MIARLAEQPRGLVLVTGPTGSGRTTTLAAMIDHVNLVGESRDAETLKTSLAAAETVNRAASTCSRPTSSARSACRWPPPCAASRERLLRHADLRPAPHRPLPRRRDRARGRPGRRLQPHDLQVALRNQGMVA